MHESQFEGIVDLFLGGLDGEEFDLLKEVSAKTYEFTKTAYGRAAFPKSALVWALLTLRHVRSLFPNPTATILEIGPGSGYFGCLCGVLGYKYIAMDVAQAFYVFQSNLWSSLFPNRVRELVSIDDESLLNASPTSKELLHIPWWKFAPANPLDINLDIDCLVCVDVIAEMHIFAMRYLGRQAARWLEVSEGNKVVYFQGTGSQIRNNIVDIRDAFRMMGITPVWSDTMGLSQRYAPHDLFFFFTPQYRPYRRELHRDRRTPVSGALPAPDDQDSDLMRQVLESRESYRSRATVSRGQVSHFYQTLVAQSDIQTDDERFWQFCNRDDWKWY